METTINLILAQMQPRRHRFKAHVRGAHRGVKTGRLQSCADEFCRGYSHRGMKAKFELLLAFWNKGSQWLCKRPRTMPLTWAPLGVNGNPNTDLNILIYA